MCWFFWSYILISFLTLSKMKEVTDATSTNSKLSFLDLTGDLINDNFYCSASGFNRSFDSELMPLIRFFIDFRCLLMFSCDFYSSWMSYDWIFCDDIFCLSGDWEFNLVAEFIMSRSSLTLSSMGYCFWFLSHNGFWS